MADWSNALVSELRKRGKDFFSLDPQKDQDLTGIATDVVAGFVPGLGTATAARDYERARRDNDYVGMGLSAVGMIPFAGGITKGINAARRIGDAAEPMTAAEKAWMTRMEKVARNKGVQHREAMREGGETIVDDIHTFNPRTIITPEDMYGKVGVQVQGDRSRAGALVSQLRGIPIEGGLKLEGGPAYAQLNKELGTGAGWASMRGAASGKQNQFQRAAEATGREPLGVYSAMGLDGVDFATPVAEAMVKQLRLLKPNKASLVGADKEIQKFAPEFVGLQSPDALAQILGKDGFSMDGAGQVRKAVVGTLKKAEYQNKGFPVYDDIIDAITQPELRDAPIGASGFTMFRAQPNSGLISGSDVKMPHGSYDTVIPGEYMGGLERSIPAEIMYPKTYEKHRLMGRNDARTHRSMQVNNSDYEVFDQQWLDGVMNYLKANGQ
jgi:hypothetical protein